jgi:NADPH:quinone reductase-like Zn-dependent oxidoreductase
MSFNRVRFNSFGGPEVLYLEEVHEIPRPASGEVRIRVKASSVSFTDIMIRKGIYPEVTEPPPLTPGYDMVGIIDENGPGCSRFNPGDMVADLTVTGAQSEFICLPEENLTSVPGGLDPADAVILILAYVTAYQMLHRLLTLKDGSTILVHGAGGSVGAALVQLAKLHAHTVIGTASAKKREFITSLGAIPVNYQSEDFLSVCRNRTIMGVDAAFDAIDLPNFKRSFKALAPGGKLITYGMYNSSLDSVAGKIGAIASEFIRYKLNSIAWNLLPNRRSEEFYIITGFRKRHPDWFKQDLATLFNLANSGSIRPLVWKKIRMPEVTKAHEMIENAKVEGKIIMEL